MIHGMMFRMIFRTASRTIYRMIYNSRVILCRKAVPVILLLVGFMLGLVAMMPVMPVPGPAVRAITCLAAERFPLTVVDDAGRQVTISREPRRIVSLAPSNTEILFALGLGDRVVGVTTYCNYPPEAAKKEKIGGFADPSIERIIHLDPDLVVGVKMGEGIIRELQKLGIPVIVVEPKSFNDTLRVIRFIGRVTGRDGAAAALVGDMEKRVRGITEKTKDIPEGKRPKVYYEIWYDPLMTAGPGTLINDIIDLAGGVNVASDAGAPYPEYSLEVLLAKNPDVMIHSYGHAGGDAPTSGEIKKRKGWSAMSFVRTGRIYLVNADIITRFGPRIVEGLEEFARAIHPELFK
ncbi:MAG: cobalamin-binding protein [Firmicutes bacterium]|nr:cobalamin-binding protein [Bacillota bacterium]